MSAVDVTRGAAWLSSGGCEAEEGGFIIGLSGSALVEVGCDIHGVRGEVVMGGEVIWWGREVALDIIATRVVVGVHGGGVAVEPCPGCC